MSLSGCRDRIAYSCIFGGQGRFVNTASSSDRREADRPFTRPTRVPITLPALSPQPHTRKILFVYRFLVVKLLSSPLFLMGTLCSIQYVQIVLIMEHPVLKTEMVWRCRSQKVDT